jgi:hypothetical protein
MPTDLIDVDSRAWRGDLAARSSMPNDAPVGLYRPVLSARGIGRWLRSIVGVKEDVLDWAPEERARYARLGAIVLNTGLLAGLSMMAALNSVLDGSWWAILPVGLVWGYLIVTFDSWLIASTHGVQHFSRLWIYLPRIIISILLGIAIAEPLVLWVFHPSIRNEIAEYRKTEIERYETRLKACNPPIGETVDRPNCAGFSVNVESGPQALATQLANVTGQRDQLQARVAELDRQLADLEQIARDECAGRPGRGRTGVPGEGGECRRNRAKADQFRADNQVDKQHTDLIALNNQIVALEGQLAEARRLSGATISQAIAQKVGEKRANLTDRGLLDEFDALHRLADRSTVIAAASWVLRLLLIAIDCLPVLSKLMSGTTTYDALIARQLESDKRLHHKHVLLYERQDSVDLDIMAQRIEQKLRNKTGDMNHEEQLARARRQTDLAAQIDRLAEELEIRADPRLRAGVMVN